MKDAFRYVAHVFPRLLAAYVGLALVSGFVFGLGCCLMFRPMETLAGCALFAIGMKAKDWMGRINRRIRLERLPEALTFHG